MPNEHGDNIFAETYARHAEPLEDRQDVLSMRMNILNDRIKRLQASAENLIGATPVSATQRQKQYLQNEIGRVALIKATSAAELDVLEKRIAGLEAQLLPDAPERN